jgi:NAD(P)-dependent dehydrogenase (short-subunit alcohol dehydrogenase family)
LLQGKVAIVTGAASGIGRAVALLCAEHGASVALVDVNRLGGEKAVDQIKSAGGEALFAHCDVTNPTAVQDMVTYTVRQYGRLDCALHNAGISHPKDEAWDDEAFQKTLDVNVWGMMRCMRAEIPEMLNTGGGTIVNTASIYGLISSGIPFLPAYTASKHAIVGLTKAVALKFARQNIRVNALCPGPTETAMTKPILDLGPEMRKNIESLIPLGRIARPEEIAEAAIWLASDKSSFVTGHALVADGGIIVQ